MFDLKKTLSDTPCADINDNEDNDEDDILEEKKMKAVGGFLLQSKAIRTSIMREGAGGTGAAKRSVRMNS